jgi:two-component system cell cycle response regulator CpdR
LPLPTGGGGVQKGRTIMPQDPSTALVRILYVEDDNLVREITCDLLSRESREVVAVATGEEALSVFQESRFDILVTDVSLPAMSGTELVRRVKQIAPEVPVILASGYRFEVDQLRLGPNVQTIVKPFDAPQIDALISDLCI